MDLLQLKKEQQRLAPKVVLRDGFTSLKTIGGASTAAAGNKLIGCIVVCEFPSLKLLEQKTYVLSDALPFHAGFEAYREMPALVEAFNELETEPEVLLVDGTGILHPQKFGLACHLGLVLNKPTIGIADKLMLGQVEQGKLWLNNEMMGFEVKTRAHSLPLYCSPGHLVGLGTVLEMVKKTVQYPHKLPEPVHLAHKLARRKGKELLGLKSPEEKVEK